MEKGWILFYLNTPMHLRRFGGSEGFASAASPFYGRGNWSDVWMTFGDPLGIFDVFLCSFGILRGPLGSLGGPLEVPCCHCDPWGSLEGPWGSLGVRGSLGDSWGSFGSPLGFLGDLWGSLGVPELLLGPLGAWLDLG